jgi:outer membrane lipase/esterase
MIALKTLFRAGAALGVLAATAAPASAQRVSRIVAFGDSYADTGNFFALTGIPRPSVYPNGRFSNGTNFVDTMAQILGVPQDNFAIGGAFTNNGNINGPGIPGFVTEYQSFLAGGGPAAFPRVSGKFGPNDLAIVSIGGNDARAYEKSLGNTPTAAQITGLLAGVPSQAAQKVTEATVGFDALVAAGARNFTVIAGDVGRMPEVQGLPISQVGSAYATAFNTGMQSQLSRIASTGVIVNYLDLNKVGDQVAANLSAFGLISAGACPVACVSSDASLAEKYLFYVDQVHLTSRGFAIVGQYAVRQLEAPLQLQAQTDTGLQAAQSFGASLQGRLDLSGARGGGGHDGLAFYVTGNAASQDYGPSNRSLGYELNTAGASAGLEFGGGPAVVGAAVNYSKPKADFATGTGRVKATAWQGGIYGGVSVGGLFGQAYAGYGWVDYSMRRTAVIDDLHGSTSGHNALAGAKVGYLAGLGGLSVGPVAALDYARTKIGAYTETGDPVLTAGLEARANVESGGLAVRPYASIVAEKDFDGDGRTIRYAGTASPTIVNIWNLPGRSKDTYARLTAGASFEVIGSLSLQVQGSKSFGRDGGNDMNGFAGLKLGF